jgi:hypothetical protein
MNTGIQITLVTIGIACGLTFSVVRLRQKPPARTLLLRSFSYPGVRVAKAVDGYQNFNHRILHEYHELI